MDRGSEELTVCVALAQAIRILGMAEAVETLVDQILGRVVQQVGYSAAEGGTGKREREGISVRAVSPTRLAPLTWARNAPRADQS